MDSQLDNPTDPVEFPDENADLAAYPALIGLTDYPGPPRPVILVPAADAIDPIAANYPRATVISLPADAGPLRHQDAWGAFLPILGADVTLWPLDALSEAYFEALVPILFDAGVRTLRWAVTEPRDCFRYAELVPVWRGLPLLRPALPAPTPLSDST